MLVCIFPFPHASPYPRVLYEGPHTTTCTHTLRTHVCNPCNRSVSRYLLLRGKMCARRLRYDLSGHTVSFLWHWVSDPPQFPFLARFCYWRKREMIFCLMTELMARIMWIELAVVVNVWRGMLSIMIGVFIVIVTIDIILFVSPQSLKWRCWWYRCLKIKT